MCLALQDVFPEAFDLRPHHMSLADVKGKQGAIRMEQISRGRTRVWKPSKPGEWNPEIVRELVKGTEHVFGVVRNPYDFLASCYVRQGRGCLFVDFVRSFNQPPYIEDGRIYYHEKDCETLLRHERLQRGLNYLMKTLDLPEVPLERHNETKDKRPWESYYTPEAFAIVNDRFGHEFCKFYPPRTE